jgi:SAM-dependent methyltransferase
MPIQKRIAKFMIKYQGISTLEVLKEARNYNKWLADTIIRYLSSPALEVGAGTGNLSSHFLQCKPLYLTDVDAGLVTGLRKKFQGVEGISVEKFDVSKIPPNKLRASLATVFGINVLEHIKDDERALRNISQLLQKDGKLLLLVPAKKWAFTKLDEELGHFRRYEKQELVEKLERSGYKVEKIFFINIVGLLSWWVRNKVKRKNIRLKPYHIKVFDSIVPLLRNIESRITLPMGISLVVVARKI